MLTYKKKGGDRYRTPKSKSKPKKVGTSKNVQRFKKIELPTTNSSTKKKQKNSSTDDQLDGMTRRLVKRALDIGWRLPKFPKSLPPPPHPLPPPLPIFTEHTTSTLSHGVGSWDPKIRLTRQEIIKLATATYEQTTYLFVSHGDPPEQYPDGNIELVQNDALAKMRFGVAANDGGTCFTTTNPKYVFITSEHTLGYGTTINDHVLSFKKRYPFEYEHKLSFPNLRISEGYLIGNKYFPSGIWRVSKGEIALFGISEVIRYGFVNGIDLTQNDANKELAMQGFLKRFKDDRASREVYHFQQFVDQMTDDPHFQAAKVVNVLFSTCSGVETKTVVGQELSRAWRGESKQFPPHII